MNKYPEWYYKGKDGTVYNNKYDPQAYCWNCEKTFLCDATDATCRLCGASLDKKRKKD